MAKTDIKPTKPQVNICTIGDIGHGKTTLTNAILKVLHDKSPELNPYASVEEMDTAAGDGPRGTAVAGRQVEYQSETRHYSHLDYDGTLDPARAMITSARADGAILVIAADEGVTSETKRHILLASQTGIPYIAVALNKADLVEDGESLELLNIEIRELLNEYEFGGDNAPVVTVSALNAVKGDPAALQSIGHLIDALDNDMPQPTLRADKPGSATPRTEFEAIIHFLAKNEGGRSTSIADNSRMTVRLRTSDVVGTVTFPKSTTVVTTGDSIDACVRLSQPVALEDHLRFTVHEDGHTIGFGQITKINQ